MKKIPSEYPRNHSTFVKLSRRAMPSSVNNWRGISLLSIPGKLLSHIILSRIYHLDEYPRDGHHGFSENCSCTDLIFTPRMLTEESCEWHNKFYMIFIDFEKAFDSLDHQSLSKFFSPLRYPRYHSKSHHGDVQRYNLLCEDSRGKFT